MGKGNMYFIRALEVVVANQQTMIIKCKTVTERNALRVMLFRLRDEYSYKVDRDIKQKMAITLAIVEDAPCIRIRPPAFGFEEKECYIERAGELIRISDGEQTDAIRRLVKLMTDDGCSQDEIGAAVEAAKEKGKV